MWLVVVDLRRSGAKWRGATVGLAAAVKLTPILYLPYFAVRRDWRSVAQGVGTFVALSLAAWLVLPSDSLLYWFHEVWEAARIGSVGYLVELLTSPISWSHHWSWLAVAPFAAFSLWRHRRWTSVAIGATIGVGVAAPYWWGVQGGLGGFLANNALVLSGTAVLTAWGVRRRTVGCGSAAPDWQ